MKPIYRITVYPTTIMKITPAGLKARRRVIFCFGGTDANLILLAGVCGVVVALAVLFYKEIQAVLFHREMALAVGIPANAIFYALLFLTGATITASFKAIGGLLIFSLIINPAAAAYQLTYSLKRMFLLSTLFGVLSGWMGLLASYLFNVPSGAVIIVTSSLIFALATLLSPKRKMKGWQIMQEVKDDRV